MIKSNISGMIDELDFNIKKLVKKILRKISKKLKIKNKHIVSYIFIDNNEIHRINKEYRNIDRPTDVISFAYIDSDPNRELPLELGDIFVSIDKIKEQAEEYGHSTYRECAFLITHGILHLLGYDHIEEDDELEMFTLQDEILNELKIFR